MVRLILRTLVFLGMTFFLASLFVTVLFAVALFAFDPNPDSLFEVFEFGGGWPIFLAGLLLAGGIVWHFLPLFRRDKDAHADS